LIRTGLCLEKPLPPWRRGCNPQNRESVIDDEDNQPFVSVVTPVYNTEKYLAACIESVLGQTYANWEYVIVNNRSTDRSLQIAESYARLDPRIRIVTNPKHLKQMENLNRAFHLISKESKYCKVIHADDWLFPECLSRMVAVAEAHPTVGIVGSYRLDERIVNLDELPFPSPCTDGKEIARRYFQGGRYLFGSPSSLLIRSDLIRKRPQFYDESTLHGDKLACFDHLA
jgi:glycosyltransferase involved in cell wall biosynthesis